MNSYQNPSDYFNAEGHLKTEFTKITFVLIFLQNFYKPCVFLRIDCLGVTENILVPNLIGVTILRIMKNHLHIYCTLKPVSHSYRHWKGLRTSDVRDESV